MGGTDGYKEIIHNLFLVPDRNSLHDSLKFDLHEPENQLGAGRKITVSLRADVAGYEQFRSIGTIDLEQVSGINSSPEEIDSNIRKIGYGTEGFETFYLNVPQELRGKAALLKFEINDGTVYLDDISFGKKWEPSMTLAEAEEYTKNSYYSGSMFHHGTSPAGADSIANIGVDPTYFNREYSVFGPGLYLSNTRSVAEIYSDGAVLDIRLNVKNPKIYSSESAYQSILENYGLTNGLQLLNRADLINHYTGYLKSQGDDALQIGNPLVPSRKFVVVFDPKQVVVVRP
jgi:hypothetical protein